MSQLKAVFRCLPDDEVADGILSSVTSGDLLDIRVAVHLLRRVVRPDLDPFRVAEEPKSRLRAYLKSSVNLLLRQDDFDGDEKADLALSIAKVGKPEDMTDLVTLIRADIERVQRGRAARAAGDRGPLANGSFTTCAGSHIAAVVQLDPAGAEQVLIDLLPEPEYFSAAAAAMARDFVPQPERSFVRKLEYKLMWAAREDRTSPPNGDQRRARFAAALNAEIKRLRDQNQEEQTHHRP